MRDLKTSRPLFNLWMREVRDHFKLTIAMNKGLSREYRGHLFYRHRYLGATCPNHVCTSRNMSYSYGCRGKPDCPSTHTSIYFKHECGDVWLLGYSFPDAFERITLVQHYLSYHQCDFTHRDLIMVTGLLWDYYLRD